MNYQETKDILIVQGVKAKGFGIIPKLVMQDKRISIESKAIYSYFCSYAGSGDTAFPSINKICSDLCISDERFRKYFKIIKDYGYITVEQAKERGKFSHNIYTLVDKPTPKTPYPEITDTGNSCTEKSDTENLSTNNNNVFKNNSSFKNNRVYKNNTHREAKIPVCEDYISGLKSQIRDITGFNMSEKKLKELLIASSLERIIYHLEHWHIHKQNQKRQGAGYFITVIENDIEPIEPQKQLYNQNKIPQRDNFDQRDYTDEELEKYYANLTQ